MKKRFWSCFVCGVEIDDKFVTLEDTARNQFFIDRANASKETLLEFKDWFNNVYMKGIPKTMTIIDYSIGENADGEAVKLVNKLVSPIDASCNAEDDDGQQA